MEEEKPEIEEYDLWERVGYVEITIGDTKKFVLKGIDFKFSITKVLANMVEGTCSVEIHGLKQDTINDIVTVCNQQTAISQRKVVKVYAGYRDAGNKDYEGDLIACMDIIYAAVTTPPPEMWVKIEGIQSAYYRFIGFNYRKDAGTKEVSERMYVTTFSNKVDHLINPPTDALNYRVIDESPGKARKYITIVKKYQLTFGVEELCEDLVKCINQAFEKDGVKTRLTFETYITDKTKTKQVSQFLLKNTTLEHLTAQIGTTFDVFCFIEPLYGGDHDVLVVMDKTENLDQSDESQMARVNRRKRKIRTKILDVDHGLIGIPSIANSTSLKCRCLLDPRLSVGDYVDITSKVMPVVGETKGWQINRVSFSGHMRGTEWYTDITAANYKLLGIQMAATQNPKKTYTLR